MVKLKEEQDVAEKLVPQRPYTRDFYPVLLCVVLPLGSIVPSAWCFVVYSLYTGKIWLYTPPKLVMFSVALCEVFFSIYYYHLSQRIAAPAPLGPGLPHEIQPSFLRLLQTGLANLPEDGHDLESLDAPHPGSPAEHITPLTKDDPRAVDFRASLRNWFSHAPWSAIRTHQARQWLYWAIFNDRLPAELSAVPKTRRAALDHSLEMLQRRCGVVIPEGSNPAATPITLTLDPLNVTFRPLSFYTLVWGINRYLRRSFAINYGVRGGSYNGLEYLLRTPPTWAPTSHLRPLVILHGLGLGLLQYKLLLHELLLRFPDRPVLFLLQPHISQDFFHPRYLSPMGRAEMVEKLAGLLTELGWVADLSGAGVEEGMKKYGEGSEEESDESVSVTEVAVDGARGGKKLGITLLSHSNGTYTHAWILKSYPHMVARSCFVDPVTFCSWEGDVCYNFLYRPPRSGMELLMKYVISTEIGVANLLQRHFDWSANSLFFEEIPGARDPRRTMYVLGGRDDILNAKRVKKYLTSHGVKSTIHNPAHEHTMIDDLLVVHGSARPTKSHHHHHHPNDNKDTTTHDTPHTDDTSTSSHRGNYTKGSDSGGRTRTRPAQIRTRAADDDDDDDDGIRGGSYLRHMADRPAGVGGLWFDPHAIHGQGLLAGTPGNNRVMRWLKEE